VHSVVTEAAVQALTPAEIRQAIQKAGDIASAQPDWAPGKCVRVPFTKAGREFMVSQLFERVETGPVADEYYRALTKLAAAMKELCQAQPKEPG
jgi:hypothetical protein